MKSITHIIWETTYYTTEINQGGDSTSALFGRKRSTGQTKLAPKSNQSDPKSTTSQTQIGRIYGGDSASAFVEVLGRHPPTQAFRNALKCVCSAHIL